MPAAPSSPFEHRVARAISACTRCRSRKSKCDGKLPACTACEKAKVECVGFDAISKKNVSRSYIHDLEQEVVRLRKKLGMSTDLNVGFDIPEDDQEPESSNGNGLSLKTEHEDENGDHHGANGSARHGGPSSRTPTSSSSLNHPYHPALHRSSHSYSGVGASQHHATSPAFSSGHSPASSGRIVDGVVSDIAFAGVEAGTDREHHHVGHFMGAASGVSLARLVLDAVLRDGAASGPPVPERKSSMEPATSRPLSPHDTASPREYPTSNSRHNGHLAPDEEYLAASTRSPHAGRRAPAVSIPALPPPAAVDRLVQVYIDFVQIMLPILHMPTFQQQLARVRDRSPLATESDVFFVLMVLALSTMALSRSLDPTAELRMSSEAFYVEAAKHMESIFHDNTYEGLQAILLCCYYSLLNPARGSIWHLVGLASRVCVDYGLHQETLQQQSLSPLETDMRRRLFSAVYNLDRLLCHALGRPPSIPDDYVDVQPFSDLPDHAITDHGLLSSEPDPYKKVALNFIPLRQLQSLISCRLYAVKTTDPPTEEWFEDMFNKLKNWLANAPEPRGSSSSEGYAISFHNTVLLLFRPSPACPRPSRDALATCLSSSSYIIRIFRSMQRKNKINWWWLSCHYVFMAGITYLYGLWNMNLLGDSTVTPSLMEAHLDIQACSVTLEALSAILSRLSGEGKGHAESAMRHSFQSRGMPSPLPKTELPTEIRLLDKLFLNPMGPHPKASDSTACAAEFSAATPETNLHIPTPGSTDGLQALAMAGLAEGDLAATGFDFLTFLAADDGGQGANAVWEQTEQYRQDMPIM